MNKVTVKGSGRVVASTFDLKPGECGRITNDTRMHSILVVGDIVLKLCPFRGADHPFVVLRTGVVLMDTYPCELVTEAVTIKSED